MFTTKSLKKAKTRMKAKYTKKKIKKPGKIIFKVCIYLFIFFLVAGFILSLVLYKKYLTDLPSVQEMEKLEFAEASTIYDKNGVELYKVFKEKRTYVPFEEINENMINALVAGEDKRFWENPGIDLFGITRAALYYFTGRTDTPQGTSTLTQQLIRNTIIENELSIERKIKEMYLAVQLTNGVSKEKILELYLNKIEFGSNAFGIEQAAKTFFDTSAKDLGVLESSMLASLPKTPTGLSPYNYPKRLVGYPYIYNSEDEENIIDVVSQKDKEVNIEMVTKLTDYINGVKGQPLKDSNKILLCNLSEELFKINQRIDSGGCSIQEYSQLLNMLNAIQIQEGDNIIEYQTGRKDFILGRMLEDGYITFDEYKEALINGIGYKFTQSKENIKAPHFVFYVKEYLEEKYGADVISKGGLKIYTTLDYEKQLKVEEIVQAQVVKNTANFNAKNAGLISLDNKNGTIEVMVGSTDYFDEDNKGNVNITTSKLQPGSTFKPFVYSIATFKNEIGTKTPMYDLETQFPGYSPKNFDGEFRGKMNFSTALNESRNIPAIKMFYLAGGEKAIVNFMNSIGVDSLNSKGVYGAPLALGTGEMTPLELAKAYSVFANMGIKKEISPILKIEDSKGNIIDEFQENKGEQVISKGQSYLLNSVLSDTTTRPAGWNFLLTLNGRKVAAKTGTSTKQFGTGDDQVIYPANLWTAGYTPQYTTVAWAGNTDGQKLGFNGSGLGGAGPIWKQTMNILHDGVQAEVWTRPPEIKTVNISEVSGLLPSPDNQDNSFLVESLFINKPTQFDNSFREIQVDALCNGKVTDNTPEAAKRTVTLVQFSSLYPGNPAWENPVQEWVRSGVPSKIYGNIQNILTSYNDEECERSGIESNIEINSLVSQDDIFSVGLNSVTFGYRSSNPIIRVDVLLGNQVVDTISIDNKTQGIYKGVITLPFGYEGEKNTITFRAVDNQYFSSEKTQDIYISAKDLIKPIINIENPADDNIVLYEGQEFRLRGEVIDRSPISVINIYLNGDRYKIGIEGNIIDEMIQTEGLEVGTYIIRIDTIDNGRNKSSKEITLEVLKK